MKATNERDEEEDFEVEITNDGNKVRFEGLPSALSMQMELSFTKKDKENDPATCLYLLIRAQQDAMKGLRSRREIQ